MELVYLWVEDYKNIKKQGFNFSPRFRCEFKDEYDENGKLKDNCKLIIDEKKDYVSIFPEDINVTAIVGENGSGKSSLLNIILEIIEGEIIDKYFLIFYDITLEYVSNFQLKTRIIENKDFLVKRNLFAYINKPHKHHPFRYYNIIEIDKKAIANILAVEHGKPNNEFKIASFMYLPNQIEIKLKTFDILIDESINFFKPIKREIINKIFHKIEDDYHKFLFICYGRKTGLSANIEILNDRSKLEEELSDKLSLVDFCTYFLKVSNETIYDISKLTEEQKNIYMRENGYFEFFDFDMIDREEKRFDNLSHGEQMIFGQLLNIYFFSMSNQESLIFLFDEPEIALHPNWQRNYINELYNILIQMKKKYHFIITSHSPFILSDLPKENVIFLQKDEKTGNCINVTNKVDINPFGANIHTLLSHGFFMKDGLMGEFAKNKISKILNFLNGKNKFIDTPINQIKPTIEIIGEDFLREKLLKMYDEKFKIKSKDDEIKELKAEIERLKNVKNNI